MGIPKVLVIAGSDSSGGAGLEADQRVLAAHGVYACTTTTALTAQNTLGVEDVHITPPAFVKKQLTAVLDDIKIDAMKMGMLASAQTIEVVVDVLSKRKHEVSVIVIDPVMVSTSGAQLLPDDARHIMRNKLLPIATVLTPNIPEAMLLLDERVRNFTSPESLEEMKELARCVQSLGPKAVLLKGGHIPLTKAYVKPASGEVPEIVVNVLYDGKKFEVVESAFSNSKNTHGTGCSLASALTAALAKGTKLGNAVKQACRYVEAGISTSEVLAVGRGTGPINHFHSMRFMPFAEGQFLDYLLDREDVRRLWHQYTHHAFVEGMANASLPQETFKRYLIQDYLYLVHFARTNALAAYKSDKIDMITASSQIVSHIRTEMSLHLEFCKTFGLSKEQIEATKESLACIAYSRYVLDIGQSQDWLALQISLAPCLLGYGSVARRIVADETSKKKNNPYWKWFENYVADDYQQAVKIGSDLIEQHIIKQSPERIEELVRIFLRATEMEVAFWNLDAHP